VKTFTIISILGGIMNSANKKHKDSLFTFLFSKPDILRELYSAIEGVALPPDIPIDINTLSGVLFRKQINDISFLIDDRLIVLIEHQSTINNNIPLRFLMYIGRLYEKITDPKKKFVKKLGKIPEPEFIVLYNGKDPFPDYKELKLSDAFKNTGRIRKKIPLELSVKIYNINKEHNQEILNKSNILKDYSILVEKIREYEKNNNSLDKALSSAVKYCIENNVLSEFLRNHSSEVINMLYAEYSFEEEAAVIREEAREEGREEGREEWNLIIAKNMLSKGSTPQFVHEITGLTLEEIKKI
jgi:predicted transposase/invertase (TIGR01784 family)